MTAKFKVGDEVLHNLYSHWGTGTVVHILETVDRGVSVQWGNATVRKYWQSGQQGSGSMVYIRKLTKLDKALK